MRILLTGSSGLIGHALVTSLTADGHTVVRLMRSHAAPGRHISWDPDKGVIDAEDLEDFDAVVHLAGESIVGRWTAEKKARILESRVKGTKLLSEALVHLRMRAHGAGVSVRGRLLRGPRRRGAERRKFRGLDVSFEGSASMGGGSNTN